ncbi:unnamed protein product [Rotaria sp. Silwood1]|nr:unnamed protein product [Rotaria sp. Silwood1]
MPYVAVTDSSSYAARFDMIAAIVGDQVLPPIVYSPQDRKTREVKGINSQMLIDFIEDILCPAKIALDLFPQYLVLDKYGLDKDIDYTFSSSETNQSIGQCFVPRMERTD